MLARYWPRYPSAKALWRFAWLAWLTVIVALGIRGVATPEKNTVIPCYFEGGRRWAAAEDLYARRNDTCRYSPLMHAVLAPISLAPAWLGPLLWRGLNAGVLLIGLRRWLDAVCPAEWSQAARAWVLLLTLPLAIGSLNNGQANALIMGAMLWAAALAVEGRWWAAAIATTVAVSVKLYPLAFALLLVAAFPRRLGLRLLVCLTLGLAIPLVLQDLDYVARQYQRWLTNLIEDDRSRWALEYGYRDLWQLIRAAHLPLDRQMYVLLQMSLACVLGLTCMALARFGVSRRRQAWHALGLGLAWLTLCGPATESCTYILLAPLAPAVVLDCWYKRAPFWVLLSAALAAGTLWCSVVFVGLSWGKTVLNYGLQPAAALLLLVVLLRQAWTEPELVVHRSRRLAASRHHSLEVAA